MRISYLPCLLGICTLTAQAAAHLASKTSTDSKVLALMTHIAPQPTTNTNHDFSAVALYTGHEDIWPDTKGIWDKYCKSVDCIDSQDPTCKGVVEKSFEYFLNVNLFAASLFAQDCIGRNDPACKTIVKEAFSKLLKKDPQHAASFLFSYLKQGNNAHKRRDHFVPKILQIEPANSHQNAYHTILANFSPYFYDLDPEMAFNFASACKGKSDSECEEILLEAFSTLTENTKLEYEQITE